MDLTMICCIRTMDEQAASRFVCLYNVVIGERWPAICAPVYVFRAYRSNSRNMDTPEFYIDKADLHFNDFCRLWNSKFISMIIGLYIIWVLNYCEPQHT